MRNSSDIENKIDNNMSVYDNNINTENYNNVIDNGLKNRIQINNNINQKVTIIDSEREDG